MVYAQNLDDATLDRSYDYDHVGRPTHFTSGSNARHHTGQGGTPLNDGPYSQSYSFDVWGNRTYIEGWGGIGRTETVGYTNNRRNGFSYDAAGNVTNDLGQTFTYDATGQQASASYSGYLLQQTYDGDRLRVKKVENGAATYYLRSSVLGGQIVAELNGAGSVTRGFVYLGGQLLAVQQNNQVSWVHQDPVVKSKRVTDSAGIVISTVELDPWGGDTNRSNSEGFQPRRFTTYDRDGNASDEAMHRRYNRWHSRFDQPDPYGGSYDLTDPQSFNRYSYVQNDPVNFVDPLGLNPQDPLTPPTTPAIDPATGQPYPGGVPGPVANVDVNIGRASGSNNGGFVGVFGSGDTGITTVDSPIEEGVLVGGPQNPEGLDLWRAGVDELRRRIEAQDACANFFGGKEKAVKALEKLKAQMGNLPSPAIAAIAGNKVTLDSTRFTNAGAPVQTMRQKRVEGAATIYSSQTHNLSGAMFSAFVVGHEFGHKMKSYDKKNDKEKGDPVKVGLNSEQLRAACFSELAAP